MPTRTDLETILIIGSGPIVIGQACEFDYSGTQACRVLRDEGYRVVLVNSNPATIMTDPEFADATYVEPLDVAEPHPRSSSASGPTRCSRRSAARPRSTSRSSSHEAGVLAAVRRRAHRRQRRGDPHRREPLASSRRRWRRSASPCPRSGLAYTLDEAMAVAERGRLPAHRAAVVHPRRRRHRHRRTTPTRCATSPRTGSPTSPVSEILIEQSVRRAGRSTSSR